MNKKTKYVILAPAKEELSMGGIVVFETIDSKTKCFVSLFGMQTFVPTLLVDDMVNVRQFEVSPSFSEIELDDAIGFATDIVVGVFDGNQNLLASGSTFGDQSQEQKDRLLVALEKKGGLEHFAELAKDACKAWDDAQADVEPTFFEETQMLLFELFAHGIPDSAISKFVPNSKWVKVFLKNDVVGIGVVEREGRIFAVGLAFPVFSRKQTKKDIDGSFKFFPQNPKSPDGFGYYIVLQSAKDGSLVNFG